MDFKEEFANFNEFYYSCLNNIFRKANEDNTCLSAKFLADCEKYGSPILQPVLYKKTIDDIEEVIINSQVYKLLPMGLINSNIPTKFIDKNFVDSSSRYRLNNFHAIHRCEPKLKPFYYPNDSLHPIKDSLKRLCESYIKHYKDALGEEWTEEDFYNMFFSLEYLSVKYAINEETKEIFAVGFFGASVRNGAGGKALTNAELYVMPEFRNMRIAKKMVGLTFEQAKNDDIKNFDSITYRVQNNDSLAFWENIGASVSGLIHIEGDIPEILSVINNSKLSK